ncbi:hypothetical protein UUU_06200 [Klebsiella pneumoniae subsp. pneumoniae DSM 30104 = JCM 1662 = NBRC 14940]|nr:hypothetical protein UUU_06200 [Klebsiella pneumoniae subsp. pneumoniae DSM 30104 = JCM 1662 = NBRC 14940]
MRYVELWGRSQNEKSPCPRRGKGLGSERWRLLQQQIDRGVAALNVQRQYGRFGVEDFPQIGDVFHRLLIRPDDDVAFLEANLCRRGTGFHIIDHHALILTLIAHFRPFNPVEDGAGVNLGLVALLQFDGHGHRFAVAQQTKLNFAADRHGADLGTQRGEAADRFPVEGGDDIAGFNARFRGRRTWHYLADEGPALGIDFHRFRQLRVQFGAHNAELTAFHLAIFHHLLGQVFHHVARDSKTDTDVAAVRRQNGGVDTDQLAVEVHQRAAGVPAVNRRIGLDKVFVVFHVEAATAQRGDNPGGHGFAQTERVADSHGVITDAQRIGVGKLNRRQVFWLLNLNQRDIRARIFADDFGIKLTAIAQLNLNRGGVVHDVVVGHHIPFGGINDDAGAQRHKFLLLAAVRLTALSAALAKRRTLERRTILAERRIIAKELLEVAWHPWSINGGATFNVNAHHRRHHLLQHRGQAWHLLCISGRRCRFCRARRERGQRQT